MSTILDSTNFLAHFPNNVLFACRFWENKTNDGKNNIANVSMDEAVFYNEMNHKSCVYFTPNGDLKKAFWDSKNAKLRTKSKVEEVDWNIYAIIWDIDKKEMTRTEVWLLPTMVVETKKWYHIYFMLKNPVSYKEYWKRYDEIETILSNLIGIDPKAKDIVRLLRVPWFKYRADNIWDTEINIVEHNQSEVKSFDEWEEIIHSAYSSRWSDKEELNTLKRKHKKHWAVLDKLFEEVGRVDVKDVLETLYPRFQVLNDWSITENWNKTRWYKRNKNLNYINNFSNDDIDDRPRGWPWMVAKQHFKNFDLVCEFFSKNYNIEIDNIRETIGSQKEIVFEELITWIEKTTWEENTEKKDGNKDGKKDGKKDEKKVGEKEREKIGTQIQWIIVDHIKKEITWYNWDVSGIKYINALIVPVGKVKLWENDEKYIIRIEKQSWEEITTLMPICWTNTELRKFLQRFWLMIPDNSIFFVFLFNYIYNASKEYIITNKMWLQVINWEKVIVSTPWVYVDEEQNLFISVTDFGGEVIEVGKKDEDVKEYVRLLLKWYNWKISYTAFLAMLLWVNSWFFRNQKPATHLPQVFVFWLSGSGKTTFLDALFLSFGIRKDISALSKAFIYEKNAKHYLPIHLSEYRNSGHSQPQMIEWIMRNLFDWADIEKWRADQTTVTYESNAQYVLDWQTIFTDDAVQTRLVMLLANERYQWDLESLLALPNIYWYATTLFKDTEDFNSFVQESEQIRKWLKKRLDLKRASQRTMKNFSMLLALSDRLWLSEHNQFVIDALLEQDWLTSQDDIQQTYMRAFNLQVLNSFDYHLHKKWIIINMVEDWAKMRVDTGDLRWFVQTINANFLGVNTLPTLSIYIDFDYVFKHETLHWAFMRMLSTMSIWTLEASCDEEYATLKSLHTFITTNFPKHFLAKEVKAEINYFKAKKQEKWKDITFD